MLKKTIKYTDYDGNERTEDFYFNLTKAEIYDMEMSADGGGGMAAFINKIISAQDRAELAKLFKKFILQCYGEKSLDGKRFIKTKELAEAFSQTEAYSQLYMELITDDLAAEAFIKGVAPADVMARAMEAKTSNAQPGNPQQ